MTRARLNERLKDDLEKARREVEAISPSRRPRTPAELIAQVRRTREKIWEAKLAARF